MNPTVIARSRQAAPIIIAAAIALLVAVVSSRQFIGWPLNATELDFIILHRILEMREVFQGTLYLALAENVSGMSVLPHLVGLLEDLGISTERQVVYMNVIQALLMCLGPAALFWVTTRDRNPWLTPMALALFVLSGKHFLAYFKLVTATFVSGFVIVALALGASRRFWPAAVMTGLIGLIHPTYFLVTLGALVFMHWLSSGSVLAWANARERLVPLKPFLFVAVPVFGYWLLNFGAIVQPHADKELWFSFMQARSDLAFPLRQGALQILEVCLFLALAGLVFRQEGRAGNDPGFIPLFWMTVFAILLFAIQIVASEILKSSSITRMALSHRVGFTFEIASYAGLMAVILRRFANGSGRLLWMFVMLVAIFGPNLPRIPEIGVNDKSMLAVLVFALQNIDDAARAGRRAVLWRTASWLLGVMVAGQLISGKPYYLMALLMALVAGEVMLAMHWRRYEMLAGKMASVLVALVIAIALHQQFWKRTDWRDTYNDWDAFVQDSPTEFDAQQRRARNEYRGFIQFVTRHVAPTEQILAVPFFLTQRYTPVPYRAVYLDWVESNYTLYMSGYTKDVIEKLNTYGIDPAATPPGCTLGAMVWAKREGEGYRCQRRALQSQATDKTMEWRMNIDKIRVLAPRVSWALIKESALCGGDKVAARWKDLALVRLADAVRYPFCDNKS